MSQWKFPKFNIPCNLLDVTDELILKWEKENDFCMQYNKNIKTELERKRSIILSYSKEIYGENSNVVKYLLKNRIYEPSLSQFDTIKSKVMKAREDEKKKIFDAERQKSHSELVGKAIKFLTDRNKVINVDFDIDNAILFANDIAFEEATYNKKKELAESGNFIDFDGNDNCEICRGWNGTEHRCQCGNRRVSWSGNDSEDFFLNPHIHGEAY